jgi:hypothetical protein
MKYNKPIENISFRNLIYIAEAIMEKSKQKKMLEEDKPKK